MKKSVYALLLAMCSTIVCAAGQSTAVENDYENQGSFVIQSGAFADPMLADAQAGRVSLFGVPSTVVTRQRADGNFVRVVRSKRMKQKEAEALAERLFKEHSVSAMVIAD
ncbi:SPOR domain-containing protein [Conchiformibius steedae]|uniref:SPOR domain-containing protein n=1 Tax=Conchiformibius steedae TaxID=153493 RepID=A0A3P2A8F6_9NEIS|nr:SPOR domain-containing protein [Conchiformibius steedae]RRD91265.1 SPOR domain-containing protein [Conchiformibius steedae]